MESCNAQDVCKLPDKLTASATHTRGGRSPSGQHIPRLRRVPVNVLEEMYSTLARSHRPHRKHENDKWNMSILSHAFSKLGVSPTLGYKHQRHRPGSGIGDGTNHAQSAGSPSGLVLDRNADAESSVNAQRGRQKQRNKRRGDDDEPIPPKRLAMHDDENNGPHFLCPFYVRNRYPQHKCSTRRFKRVSDVRQHLLRVHIQDPYCPTCGGTFDNDQSHEQLNRHIAARTCQSRSFTVTGITQDQFDTITMIARQRTHRRDSERWLEMWRIIFPDAKDPDSPYESEETDFIQGMLDTRAALESDRLRALISGTPLANFGPHELSIINAFIVVARDFQSGHNGAARVEDSSQDSLAALASTQAAQGSSIPAPSSSPVQPLATQAGGLELATDTLAHAPPLVQPSILGNPTWAGIYQPEIGEGSSQPWENQQIPCDAQAFHEQFGYYPWWAYRQA